MFNVLTPLGFQVRCSEGWWYYVSTVKHPVLENQLDDAITTLSTPEVRRSTKDPAVLLFAIPWLPHDSSVLVRKENGEGAS